MAYILQFNTTDTLAATLNSGATSTTLTTGSFGTPTGTQLYVVDYDVPAKAEIISASVATTAVTSITRGLTGGAAGTTNHAIGAKIASIFVPQHYSSLLAGTAGFSFDKARVTNSANVSTTSGVSTRMTWDTETYDTNGLHSTSVNTGRLTCVTAGTYLISATINWANNSTGIRQASIVLNGATTIGIVVTPHGGTTDLAVDVLTTYALGAGDYVEIFGQQNSGGALNMLASNSHFQMTMIP